MKPLNIPRAVPAILWAFTRAVSPAIRQRETNAENVLPQIKVIGNSWISLIAYQAKGFAYIQP
jgi:intracellular sulfur oxidation DsrE/DsrF family protein